MKFIFTQLLLFLFLSNQFLHSEESNSSLEPRLEYYKIQFGAYDDLGIRVRLDTKGRRKDLSFYHITGRDKVMETFVNGISKLHFEYGTDENPIYQIEEYDQYEKIKFIHKIEPRDSGWDIYYLYRPDTETQETTLGDIEYRHRFYNKNGKIELEEFYNKTGKLISLNGVHRTKYTYSKFGHIKTMEFFSCKTKNDENGFSADTDCSPIVSHSGFHKKIIHYFDNNQIKEIQFLGLENETPDDRFVSKILFTYDSLNRKTKVENFNSKEKLVRDDEGISVYEYKYFKKTNRVKQIDFKDEDGNAVSDSDGRARIINDYDKFGNLVSQVAYRENLKTVWHKNGISKILSDYEYLCRTDERIQSLQKLDINKPINFWETLLIGFEDWKDKECSKEEKYLGARIIRNTYYDTTFNPTTDNDGIHQEVITYDNSKIKYSILKDLHLFEMDNGKVLTGKNKEKLLKKFFFRYNHLIPQYESITYLDRELKPVLNSDGVHKKIYYYEYSDLEPIPNVSNKISKFLPMTMKRYEALYDKKNQIITKGSSDKNTVTITKYNEFDNMIHEETFSIENDRNILNKISAIRYNWDENNQLNSKEFFDKDGNPIVGKMQKVLYTYDTEKRRIKDEYFLNDGTPTYHPMSQSEYVVRVDYKYDPKGNLITLENYGKEGNLSEDIHGVSIYRFNYNNYSLLISKEFFNQNRESVAPLGFGIAKVLNEYNESGKLIQSKNYGADGKAIEDTNGIFKVIYTYDIENRLQKREIFDKDEKPVNDNLNTFRIEYEYNDKGILISYKKYNKNDFCTYSYSFDEMENVVIKEEFPIRGEVSHFDSLKTKEIFKYNEFGKLTSIESFNPKGALIEGDDGIAKKLYEYDDKGRLILESYFDAKQELKENSHEIASIKNKYMDGSEIQITEYFNSKNEPVNNKINVSKIFNRYNPECMAMLETKFSNNLDKKQFYEIDFDFEKEKLLSTCLVYRSTFNKDDEFNSSEWNPRKSNFIYKKNDSTQSENDFVQLPKSIEFIDENGYLKIKGDQYMEYFLNKDSCKHKKILKVFMDPFSRPFKVEFK
jgi:hypothetical protein